MEELQLERYLFQGYFNVKAYSQQDFAVKAFPQDYLSNNYKFRTSVLFFFPSHLINLFFKNDLRVYFCILLENNQQTLKKILLSDFLIIRSVYRKFELFIF